MVLYRNGAKDTFSIFIELEMGSGRTGLSSGIPSLTVNTPSVTDILCPFLVDNRRNPGR